MPSPAEAGVWTERVLRWSGYLALVLALIAATLARRSRGTVVLVAADGLKAALTTARPIDTLFVTTDTALTPSLRDWLRAVREGGSIVRWGGRRISATAVAVRPSVDPTGETQVSLAAPSDAMVVLSDAAGVLDSAAAAGGGATFSLPRLSGAAIATAAGQRFVASSRDSISPRRIAIFGKPSWETKFVVAALEERGWSVDLYSSVRPDTAVTQGSTARLDTARTAVVVALDNSAAARAAAITTFVENGGGVILAPDAAADPTFARLRIGSVGRSVVGSLEFARDEPRIALALRPIAAAADAIILERRGASVAVAARRMEAGRIVQLGYDETWRWRMGGPEGAPEAHRRWWSALVEAAAYRATIPLESPDENDAPLARMVAVLGDPDTTLRYAAASTAPRTGPAGWLLAWALGALIAEWALRRRRGAR